MMQSSSIECLPVDSMLRFWCFTLHLLPMRLNKKIHPVRVIGTFLIIATIIIMLVLQHCLFGLWGSTARTGTQWENANQHPAFINLLVIGTQQRVSFLFSRVDAIRRSTHPYFFPERKGEANIFAVAPQDRNRIWIAIGLREMNPCLFNYLHELICLYDDHCKWCSMLKKIYSMKNTVFSVTI